MGETENQSAGQLTGNNYQIIRRRISTTVGNLTESLDRLNKKRKEIFGAYEMRLEGTERVTTVSNTIAWDLFGLDQSHFIFGYNIQFGLKTEIKVEDVFSCYEYKDGLFVEKHFEFLAEPEFVKEFDNLYKFYKNSQFVKFHKIGTHLYMVFRVGNNANDVKCFKWLIAEDELVYVDARSEHEYKFPTQHEFTWKRTTRDQQRHGKHSHVSLDDILFIDTLGGDLTVKVENNTGSGMGIYAEPVGNADQRLDDADIQYANLGNLVVFKVRPYQENAFRYFVYNIKLQQVKRIDAIQDACVLLPENQGIIFNNGYYLQTGEYKLFDNAMTGMSFINRVASGNGEDFLYVFYEKQTGTYLLIIYNIIDQTIQTPIFCHGYALFENGHLFLFRGDETPKRHHPFQIWNTPFVSEDIQHTNTNGSDSFLIKIGNKEVVRAMAEAGEIISLSDKEDSYEGLYVDIYKKCNDILDTYHWLAHEESEGLHTIIASVRETSKSAIDEFEKVIRQKNTAKEALNKQREKIEVVKREFLKTSQKTLPAYIENLAQVRGLKGELIGLQEIPLIDKEAIDVLRKEVDDYSASLAEKTIDFLAKDDALVEYALSIENHQNVLKEITKAIECNELEKAISHTSLQLETLIDILSNLQIEDSTKTTSILDSISALYTKLNSLLAETRKRRRDLQSVEGKSEFKAQLNLLSQSLLNFIDLADTIQKCDEYLAKLLVQLEELEGKFADFDDFLEEIQTKREDIYSAFETRKSQLKEGLNKRIQNLSVAGERVLSAAASRLKRFDNEAEINAFIASDVMIEKLRRNIDDLKKLGDSVIAESLESRLIALSQEAMRDLRDKKDLFDEGTNLIRFGEHQFLVNEQELLPSLIYQDDKWKIHLSGSDYYEEVDIQEIYEYEEVWSQSLISENQKIYRAEYLAFDIYTNSSISILDRLNTSSLKELQKFVSDEISNRLDEGYTRGVHDHDAASILKEILATHFGAGDLKYHPLSRILARWYWEIMLEDSVRIQYTKRLNGAGALLKVFPDTHEFDGIKEELLKDIHAATIPFISHTNFSKEAVEYLFEVIAHKKEFVIDNGVVQQLIDFQTLLKNEHLTTDFEQLINDNEIAVETRFRVAYSWFKEYLRVKQINNESILIEGAYLLCRKVDLAKNIALFDTQSIIEGLKGDHPKITTPYHLDFHTLKSIYQQFVAGSQPAFVRFRDMKKAIIDTFRDQYRLDSFKPEVMNSFVRNRLINNVYLPLIGANLAKQIGGAGDNKRTDLMGLLLLLSPPGYGKTTLMEYVASRIGVTFMKINGPSIGHGVTSLDPASAPEATSKEELEKLNFAFELGDNVMIYLDDIQHCNPEFLQKFISLCDAQRKIEGVYKGKSKTYDFRGKKVAVVMAGNPYTESGEKFRIPDMLSNRADIYNLGDVIGGNDEDFKLSYVENAISSNKALNLLKNRSNEDMYKLIRAAERNEEMVDGLNSNFQTDEIGDILKVLKQALTVRNVVLKVNEQYILSAGTSDEYRVEPAFKLQGSYRNMNKMVEKLAPLMTDKEVWELIYSHYENECQTLTNDSEANFLKFLEIIGQLTPEDAARWENIKSIFAKNNRLKSAGGDYMGAAIIQLQDLNESIRAIGKSAIQSSAEKNKNDIPPISGNTDAFELLSTKLDAYLNTHLELQKKLTKTPVKSVENTFNQEKIINEILAQLKEKEDAIRKNQKGLIDDVRKKEEAQFESMRKKYPLVFFGKSLVKDGAHEYICFDFKITNNTDHASKIIMGDIEFRDNFGEKIHLLNITYDDVIEPGESKSWQAQTYYNRYIDQDVLLTTLDITELEILWRPRKVVSV